MRVPDTHRTSEFIADPPPAPSDRASASVKLKPGEISLEAAIKGKL